jgi:1-deoxy-D-xylulose-5-phosphate reductoisomerase
VPAENIEVVIHRQSIVHSLVEFADGSLKAQLGLPDMRLPIQYALTWPLRLPSGLPRFEFSDFSTLSFQAPDHENFRNLALAFKALEKGGNMPCILNAANEAAVASFLKGQIPFDGMPALIEQVMDSLEFFAKPSLSQLLDTDRQARRMANELCGR